MRYPLVLLALSITGPSLLKGQIIAAGAAHSLTLCADSTVWAWGLNNFGQLGDSTNTNTNSPIQVTNLNGVAALAAGGVEHSYVLKGDGTVWAWGNNASGQLGDNTSNNSSFPIQVHGAGNIGFLTGISALASGHLHLHSLALAADSTAWAWGSNSNGQLGDGTITFKVVPIKVPSLTGIVQLAGGDVHSMALLKDSSVWIWGGNLYGQLGDGTNTDKKSPFKLNGISGIIAMSAGIYHSMVLKKDGTVWTWGHNMYGELGDGSNSHSNVPVQVNGLTNVVAIAAGELHSLALKNDGTLWSWGLNDYGQLGDGTNIDKWTPVQISSLTNIVRLSGGRNHSMAIKSDDTRWSWGMNTYGQLGIGTNGGGPCSCSNIPVQTTGLCLPTGKKEMSLENSMLLFPNPSAGTIHLRSGKIFSKIEIYNVFGALVGTEPGPVHPEINLSFLRDGIYIVRLFTEHSILSEKVILTR